MVISSSCSLTVSIDNFLHACVNATNAYKGPAATADTTGSIHSCHCQLIPRALVTLRG